MILFDQGPRKVLVVTAYSSLMENENLRNFLKILKLDVFEDVGY
jgi:hypothetical protein